MIERIDVDGVPGVHVRRPGPLTVSLSFRVGTADENLPQRGLTHLVEHLALHPVGLTDYHANGHTGAAATTFHVSGTDERVQQFLTTVCAALTSLPLDRLEMERGVVMTEESRRGGASDMALWRHGATGYGTSSYPEWGVPRVQPEELESWADSWFTRGNAVICVLGDLPPGIVLPLRSGQRMPLPPLTSTVPTMPAYYSSGRGSAAFDSIVTRSTAASFFARCLESDLFERLRGSAGLSYAVHAAYDAFDAHRAGLAVHADCLEESEGALVGELIDALASVAECGISAETLEAVRRRAAESFAHPDFDAARLPSTAYDLLVGRPDLFQVEDLVAQAESVTVEDLDRVADEARATMLLRVPSSTVADWAGFHAAPLVSEAEIAGERYPSLDDSGQALVVGSDGVSWVLEAGPVTVRYDEVVAALTWPDGAIHLIGPDSMTARIEPTIHDLPDGLLDNVRDRLPADVLVMLPARDPAAIPQRTQRADPPTRPRLWRRRRA